MDKPIAAFRGFLLAVLMLVSAGASADSWAPPTTEVTPSANGAYRVTVVPRPLSGALDFFEDKVDGIGPAGQRKGNPQTSPIALVERWEADGTWSQVWQMPLVNDVAPPSVLLADDGAFLVTFDNWHSAGYGDDVVVIYDRKGDLVRKLSLEQILPPAYVAHLPRSVSSRWWSGKHALVEGGQFVELQVVQPGSGLGSRREKVHVPVRIRLADGEVMPPGGKVWDDAMARATQLEAERLAAWEALRRLRASPLSAPSSRDTVAWRDYMFEIRDRIEGKEESMGGMVLAAPGEEPGYHDADDITAWIEYFDASDEYGSESFILSSPTSDRLADLLEKSLQARDAGAMKTAHLAFIGTPAEGARVAEAARRLGARFTFVDRTAPYPPGEPLPEAPNPRWMP
jgi:hypothetical protein